MTRAIGPPLTAEESAAFVAACRSFMGVRFRHQGRNPATGLDCAGMAGAAMKAIGRNFVDLAAYGREPHKDGLRRYLVANLGSPVPKESMSSADVVLMRFDGAPRHVGVITLLPDARTGMIHVHSECKCVAEHGIGGPGDRWFDCIVEVFRP